MFWTEKKKICPLGSWEDLGKMHYLTITKYCQNTAKYTNFDHIFKKLVCGRQIY